MLITGNQLLIRNVNRQAILREIRRRPGVSRSELADLTGLTRAAIGRLVEGLTQDGWLIEQARTASAALGRRPTPLAFDPSRLVLLGAHLNAEHSRLVACTLTGEVFEQHVLSVEGLSGDEALDSLARQIASVQRRFISAGRRVCGIGVAVPGIVDPDSRTLQRSESTGWADLPVQAGLQSRLHEMNLPRVPIMAERAANCVALQHAESQRLNLSEALLYVHLGRNVAVSAMLHGSLLRGRNGMAGYVAHQCVQAEGPVCSCGRAGCVQAVLSLDALRQSMGLPAQPSLEAMQEDVGNLLESGETLAAHAVESYCRSLASFIFNLSQVHDPDQIFVGGAVFEALPDLMERLQRALDDSCAGTLHVSPSVLLMQTDAAAAAQGAAAGLLRVLLSQHSGLAWLV